jgi:hypothetical protein
VGDDVRLVEGESVQSQTANRKQETNNRHQHKSSGAFLEQM